MTRASGIFQNHITTNDWDSEHDEDRFLDLNQFVSALFAELPEARMKVTDLMHMAKLDNKNRFEFLAIAGHQRATGINQTYWPLKIRAATGHNNVFIRSENDLFFNADVLYVRPQDAGRDLSDFRGTGAPVMESIEDVSRCNQGRSARRPAGRRWSPAQLRQSPHLLGSKSDSPK